MSYFTNRWFLTLFSYDLPPETVMKIWMLFCVKCWKIIIKLILGIIKSNESNQFLNLVVKTDIAVFGFALYF